MALHTKEQLKKDLAALGIRRGNIVLMHASFKALGGIEDGAAGFFQAFIEYLGEDGTLVLPAFSYDFVTRENPVFDRQNTPVCVGYMPEFFRTNVDGVIRSMHATHSCCAVGKYAKVLTEGHEKDLTPVGENSPLTKLPKYNGKILMVGCGTTHNTAMHGVEELVGAPYCLNRENPVQYTLKDGDTVIKQTAYRHYFRTETGKHVEQRYDKLPPLLNEKELSRGKLLDADCYLMDAKAVWEKGSKKMQESPFYFVDYPTD